MKEQDIGRSENPGKVFIKKKAPVMTEKEIEKNAASDPDNPPLAPEDWKTARFLSTEDFASSKAFLKALEKKK